MKRNIVIIMLSTLVLMTVAGCGKKDDNEALASVSGVVMESESVAEESSEEYVGNLIWDDVEESSEESTEVQEAGNATGRPAVKPTPAPTDVPTQAPPSGGSSYSGGGNKPNPPAPADPAATPTDTPIHGIELPMD